MVSTPRASVVIVSEDEALTARLAAQCRRERINTVRAGGIGEVAAMVRGSAADVVAVDLALPNEDGLDVVRRLRQESEVPLVLLSEDAAAVEEEVGLALGADDFLSREVPPRLFVARVKVLLRRARPAGPRTLLRLGPLELDTLQLRATVNGRELGLTLAEIRLLEALMSVSGSVLSRQRLLGASGAEAGTHERTVDVHVANIRRKLVREGMGGALQTVRRVGYRLSWPSAPAMAAGSSEAARARDRGP